ncbi:MAG TPA: hypothetical protein PKM25_15545 [Candidatus Ozemobacteraceae bacterium]|nr:hypothetical protein [Candidatus Ozemobacteraceae bacterium]
MKTRKSPPQQKKTAGRKKAASGKVTAAKKKIVSRPALPEKAKKPRAGSKEVAAKKKIVKPAKPGKAAPGKISQKLLKPAKTRKTAAGVKKNTQKNIPAENVSRISKAHAIVRQKRVIEGSWLASPWSVERIRGFMSTWGMTQAEFAIFCGVSYDTVTSWSRGRRNLVRVDHAEHIANAEKVAKKRKLPVRGGDETVAPWAGLRTFVRRSLPMKRTKVISADLNGSFKIAGVEMNPQKIRLADPIETVMIGKSKGKKGGIPVTIIANGFEISLEGKWRELGGARLLELLAPVEDPSFFAGHAGCITPGKQNLRINLWPTDVKIPMRLIAVKA